MELGNTQSDQSLAFTYKWKVAIAENRDLGVRSWQYFLGMILLPFSQFPIYDPFIWFKIQVSQQLRSPATGQHLATMFSLSHSTRSLFLNEEHFSVPNPMKVEVATGGT